MWLYASLVSNKGVGLFFISFNLYCFSLLDGDDERDPTLIFELKNQLREKDMMLTDIRLEALTSAHQLESLKETVNNMRVGSS